MFERHYKLKSRGEDARHALAVAQVMHGDSDAESEEPFELNISIDPPLPPPTPKHLDPTVWGKSHTDYRACLGDSKRRGKFSYAEIYYIGVFIRELEEKHGSPLPSHINKAQLVLAKVREAHALVGKLFLYRHIIDTTRIRPGVDSYLRSPGNYQEPPEEPEYDSEDETEFDSAFSESS